MKNALWILLALPLTACLDAPHAKPWALPADNAEATPEPGAVAPATTPQRFVVHEWGTYTSLQGSDGRILPGMHYEEESLPAFVHGRIPPSPSGTSTTKRVEDLLLDGITQKLETPVIYFYGAPARVEVDVRFPRGVISQWYPAATSFAPQVYAAQFTPDDILDGRMTWSLDVLDIADVGGLIAVPADDVWAPSRNVDALPVRFGDETEKFIFYRGLGRFDMPFRVTSTGSEVSVRNDSAEIVPDMWILHFDGEHGAVAEFGVLGAGQSKTYRPTPKELPLPDYLDTARRSVAAGLVRSGLTEDEAWAMVDTWNHSYFQTTGLRVLYVAPRKWTDELLPITISPEPDELVRTLIGRVEVLTQDDEVALLQRVEGGESNPAAIGRFAEARLQRLLQLTTDSDIRARILEMIAQTRLSAGQ